MKRLFLTLSLVLPLTLLGSVTSRMALGPFRATSDAKVQQQKSSEPTSDPTTKGLKEPQKVLASCADNAV